MGCQQEKGLITGLIRVISRGISSTACERAKEYGRKVRAIAINTKATIKTIRSGATASSHGRAAIFIKGITREMCEVGTARCIGRMAVITRGSG